MYQFWFLFGILSAAHGSQSEQLDTFVGDIIDTWKLTSPTILYDSEEAPEICYADQSVLCLLAKENEQILSLDHNDTGILSGLPSQQIVT